MRGRSVVGCVCVIFTAAVVTWLASSSAAQPANALREARWYAGMLASTAVTARQYAFDVVIDLARKTGENQREATCSYSVRMAVAPHHKYLFRLGDKADLQYLVVSDGRRTWAYIPATSEYMQVDAVVSPVAASPDAVFSDESKDDVDPILCGGLIMPLLANINGHNASVVDIKSSADVSSNDRDGDLPVLTVLSGNSDTGRQSLTEVTFQPETFAVAQLNWSKSAPAEEASRFAFMRAAFSRFEIGQEIPASYFVFDPGNAQRVETLPISGLDATVLTGKVAPDFEYQLPGGGKARLADFRDRPVVILFTAPDCEPCAEQAATLRSVTERYRERVPAVLEIGDGSPGTHIAFHIRLVPSMVLIDPATRIVRFVVGARDSDATDALLRESGLSFRNASDQREP